jgi:predicted RNA-binding Zn-ribbon protein involved in translation (DUF1610 family)
LVVAAWAASGWWSTGFSWADASGTRSFDIESGRAIVRWQNIPVPDNNGLRWHHLVWEGWRWRFARREVATLGVAMTRTWVPLWTAFLAAAAPAAVLWRINRRADAAAVGRCAACGYDLSGLAVGVACPECGANAERGTRNAE